MTETEIKKSLASLNGWVIKRGRLEKEFKFKDFPAAIAFMDSLAPIAEKLNHHPDWSNSYNKVLISLTTHSAGGLTAKDFAFAKAADDHSIRRLIFWQTPNLPLITWAVFLILSKIWTTGKLHQGLALVAFGAIFTWAWLEIFSGPNYFRRALGAAVLIISLYSRLH